jgi:hypothetical protein
MHARAALIAGIAVVAAAVPLTAMAGGNSAAHKAKSVRAVVAEHIDAVEDCDAERLVAGYAKDAKLFFPDGVVVQGRARLTELYEGFVKPPDQGGLCGITATPEDRYRRGKTVFVKFRVEAPFLAKEYFSTDGYVIANGKIQSEMSTFDASKLVFK